jgi:aerobic carbon-monoxide dehydrogenase large subunit
VTDALSEYGIRHIDMPATPYRVWQAIQAAGGAPQAASSPAKAGDPVS